MRFVSFALSFGLLALSLGACVSRSDVEEIKRNQQNILAKLDAIGKMPAAQPQRPQGPDPSKVYAAPVGDSPAKGPKDAWVTIVEWSDFQCPFCSRVTETLSQIEKTYGNDVRLVFKTNPLPFHNRALPAANAALCANEQGKFWPMHDVLFKNQQALEDNNLEQYAKDAGLNVGRWKQCYADKKFENKIKDEQNVGNTLGARGTPAFFINGRFLSGAQPFPAFQQLIDEELKKAKASGMSKGEYYAKTVLDRGEKSM
jgi:protein-disulfide isomerase